MVSGPDFEARMWSGSNFNMQMFRFKFGFLIPLNFHKMWPNPKIDSRIWFGFVCRIWFKWIHKFEIEFFFCKFFNTTIFELLRIRFSEFLPCPLPLTSLHSPLCQWGQRGSVHGREAGGRGTPNASQMASSTWAQSGPTWIWHLSRRTFRWGRIF